MSEEEKGMSTTTKITGAIFVIVIVYIFSSGLLSKWDEEKICSHWIFADNESQEFGFGCALDNESESDYKQTRMREGVCPANNKKIYILCDHRLIGEKYNYEIPQRFEK